MSVWEEILQDALGKCVSLERNTLLHMKPVGKIAVALDDEAPGGPVTDTCLV
jgi:hypothetical protein